MHILFLTDNFLPETNAPASRTFEHTRRWVGAGHAVTIITCAPNFPAGKVFAGYRNRLWQEEWIEGVRVIRVWTYITANEGFVRRTLDYISFGIGALLAGLFVRKVDVIVSTSPQFFCAIGGCALAWLRGKPFVFELRDLWPDSIAAVGALRNGGIFRILKRLEYFMYRRAALIVSVTQSFRKILVANGIQSEKIVVVTNGVDANTFTPGPPSQPLRERHALEGKFVAAYVGTIGLAHGLVSLLDAAEGLRHRDDVGFVLVGTGAEHKNLEKVTRERGLKNVVFVGAVSKAEVKEYWRLCDVALVLLRDDPLFAHVIPSKMFEAMGTEKPIILGVRGESAGILADANAGMAITPGDGPALAKAIEFFADSKDEARRRGLAGRRYVIERFNRDRLAADMLAKLEQLIEA
jgi:colanic acid biosynthesis glycosyl transferase WcaI